MPSNLAKRLSEHRSEHQSEHVANFKNVCIYPKIVEDKPCHKFTSEEKKELEKLRWYVRYKFLHPDKKEYVRQPNFYFNINRDFPEFDRRYREIHFLKEGLLMELENGFNPYKKSEIKSHTIADCLDFALEKKENEVGDRTYKTYVSHVNNFKEWLEKNYHARSDIKKISKKIINSFLNSVAAKSSNRTRNNYKTSLGAIFSVLVDYEYLDKNIMHEIGHLKTQEKRDPTYSEKQVKDIISHLKVNDKVMLMYIYFVGYMFWRPKENCRLKVKNVNLEEKLITSPETKATGLKTKIIPDLIFEEIKEYIKGANPEDYLFTPNGPGKWNTKLDNRRNYFSGRYAKLRAEMNIDNEYNIYSFRHTSATRIYKKLLTQYSKSKSIEILSKITGHESNALEKNYIHYIDASLPEDYSQYLK